MTRRCGNCRTREATIPVLVLARIPSETEMCHICVQALETLGMGIKRLDNVVSFVPVWRRRQQRAKDYTGSVA
jgi:hypothetical protein